LNKTFCFAEKWNYVTGLGTRAKLPIFCDFVQVELDSEYSILKKKERVITLQND